MSKSPLARLAVIIPVASDEDSLGLLFADLSCLPVETEIVCVGIEQNHVKLPARVKWMTSEKGRAKQLNHGARHTTKEFLWFLHADSRVTANAVLALEHSMQKAPQALHYFNLRFSSDGPVLMPINMLGVWIRSHLMKLPFGDQGLCLERSQFNALGGFNEHAPFGEDHLLVWASHQNKIQLRCTTAAIHTSARKYQRNGWAKTTLRTMALTARQAMPELVKLLRGQP